MSWSTDLERDLDWRFAELAALRSQVALAANGSILQAGLLRSLVAMLYAHYEGFCKNAIRIYLREIGRRGVARSECLHEIATFSLRKEIRECRNSSNEECFAFLEAGFSRAMNATINYEMKDGEIVLEGESNMWSDCLADNLRSAQLHCDAVVTHKRQIDTLVGRRNAIAHGQKVVIATLREYERLEKNVEEVMLELAYAVIGGLDGCQYLGHFGYCI